MKSDPIIQHVILSIWRNVFSLLLNCKFLCAKEPITLSKFVFSVNSLDRSLLAHRWCEARFTVVHFEICRHVYIFYYKIYLYVHEFYMSKRAKNQTNIQEM